MAGCSKKQYAIMMSSGSEGQKLASKMGSMEQEEFNKAFAELLQSDSATDASYKAENSKWSKEEDEDYQDFDVTSEEDYGFDEENDDEIMEYLENYDYTGNETLEDVVALAREYDPNITQRDAEIMAQKILESGKVGNVEDDDNQGEDNKYISGQIFYTGDHAYKITDVNDEEVEFIDEKGHKQVASLEEFKNTVESDEYDTHGITEEEAKELGLDTNNWNEVSDSQDKEEKKSLASQLRKVMSDNGYSGGWPDQSDEDWLDNFLQQDERRTGNYSNVRFKTFKDRADFYNPETNKNSSPEALKNIYDFLVKNDEGLTNELNEIRDRKSNEYKKKQRESQLNYWKGYFDNIDEDMLDKADNMLDGKDFKSGHQKDVAKHEVLTALSILKKYSK